MRATLSFAWRQTRRMKGPEVVLDDGSLRGVKIPTSLLGVSSEAMERISGMIGMYGLST